MFIILEFIPNIHGLVWLEYVLHFLEYISAPHTRINLLFAASEYCCLASFFAYNEPQYLAINPLQKMACESDSTSELFLEKFHRQKNLCLS
jgi:hypothetical protein